MNKKTVIALGIVGALLLAVFVCWASTGPQALESVKELTVTVTHSDAYLQALALEEDEPLELTFRTTAKTLALALAERPEFTLAQTDEGAELAAADGGAADPLLNLRWVCYFDSKALDTPLDGQTITDGDKYYFYLKEDG